MTAKRDPLFGAPAWITRAVEDDPGPSDAAVPRPEPAVPVDPEVRQAALDALHEVQIDQVFGVECEHCGDRVADGTIIVKTTDFDREDRVCNVCARRFLEWF